MGAICIPKSAVPEWDTRHLEALDRALQAVCPLNPAWNCVGVRHELVDAAGGTWIVAGMGDRRFTEELLRRARLVAKLSGDDDFPADAVYQEKPPAAWTRTKYNGVAIGTSVPKPA